MESIDSQLKTLLSGGGLGAEDSFCDFSIADQNEALGKQEYKFLQKSNSLGCDCQVFFSFSFQRSYTNGPIGLCANYEKIGDIHCCRSFTE